jgi:F0F1-type ATP synthase assembly protein I
MDIFTAIKNVMMKNNPKALLLSGLISAILFGAIMFVFYYFVDKVPLNKALPKAGIVALLFGIINGITQAFLNRKK